ncbi:TPA: hypothetical protein CPU00_01880 [Candidatus Gastranaerophilales bacterium HUM_18]|nr:MAG TPA: hypothetical protein CPU00_01880 [Candidatus Gastranaerophilales bacterium HUM_18]
MNEQTFRQNETIAEAGMAPREESSGLSQYQEEINSSFNACFEIIDSIVPEEESQDIVILKEEVEKIYEFFKNSNLYEVKTSLENILAKLDFVMNATNTFTISEILELRNELSSAAAKFTTSCIETEEGGLTFFDIAEKISMLQGSSIYAKEIKDDIAQLKEGIDDQNIIEIINVINDILDFISENSVQLEEQMMMTLKGAVEYCASPNENIDNDLILQQLEIMKQLLELNYKKDTGVSEIKSLSTQTSSANKSNASTEIKTLHVNAQKLDLLVNQLGELIITKIKTEKNLEKIDSIKNANEACQKDLLKTSNYLRYYNRKYLQSGNTDQYTGVFVKQVFSLLLDITQNVSRTIYDLNSLYRASKEDDMKMRLIIDEMESMVKNIRVLPISTVFNSFSRMVRDIANEKGKDIDFEIEGKDTCADKKIIEEIKTPLIHILRNAIDHGIESKEERIANGKSPVGKILLSAKQDDNKVIIDVVDDGQGFNLEKIKDRAVSRGFLTQDDIDSMTDEAIMNIIFWPGFTTGDSITSISGRGIGLDVVKTKISQLNGKVKVISEFGKGSCVHIEIPVTLTTLRVFLVQISGQTFAIPIQVITTFILKNQNEIKTNNGVRSILFNGNIIPLYYLSDILELAPAPRNEKETILIIEADDKTIGLVVDKLLGDQDILQKKLSPPLYKVKNISGITNLASGELCLILNMQDIMHYDFNKAMISANNQELLTSDVLSYKRILIVDDSVTTRTMVKNILLNIGYMVDTVLDADEALVKLKLTHYDLIITDLTMPKIDGYEFIERLRNDEMYADIPIIVISSLPENQARKRLNKLSIAHYISKDNFDQADLAMQVKEILTKFHH